MQKPSTTEFIALMAMLTAMVAMSIDIMLPGLGQIAGDLGVTNPNDRQLIIFGFFLGLAAGTVFYGPLSDAIGRKPAIFAGLALYAAGAVICLISQNFPAMIAGRAIMGIGAASPRIVAMAMVRDGYAGNEMARVTSFIMMTFMIVPILAPSLGVLLLNVAHWRLMFLVLLIIALLCGLWLAFRQPETLRPENRVPLTLGKMAQGAREVFSHPVTLGYAVATGGLFGAFSTYLSASEQIFVDQYKQGDAFALWFAFLAIAMVIAQLFNGKTVMKLGMLRLTRWGTAIMIGVSALMLAITFTFAGQPPLLLVVAYLFVIFIASGLMFGNFTAMSLEPMGHIAGMASAISGALTSLIAVAAGMMAGRLYDGTFTIFASMFLGAGLWAYACSSWAEAGRRRLATAPS
jgi:MFS transporter, DHA1 family, multidrug resistance protein